MGLFGRSKKQSQRRLKPFAGRSLSANSYYRPTKFINNEPRIKPESRTESVKNLEKKKHLHLTFSKVINTVIVGVFVFLAIAATTLSSSPNLQYNEPFYSYRSKSDYKQKANSLVSSSVFNRSKLFFRSSDYETEMRTMFPEIDTVEAIVPLGGRDLTVAIRVSEPLAIAVNGTKEGLLDSNGVLATLNENVAKKDDELFNLRFSEPQDSFEVGNRLLTEDEVELLKLLQTELRGFSYKGVDSGLTIDSVNFSIKDGQFIVKLKETPYFIKLSTYGSGPEQVGAFKASIKLLARQNQLPSQYIDVRVPGRVYVQ